MYSRFPSRICFMALLSSSTGCNTLRRIQLVSRIPVIAMTRIRAISIPIRKTRGIRVMNVATMNSDPSEPSENVKSSCLTMQSRWPM